MLNVDYSFDADQINANEYYRQTVHNIVDHVCDAFKTKWHKRFVTKKYNCLIN